ncbi:SDR family NAD(P)-dependent oxidoreductase [Micromonospora chalcea]|uniref:SDR family NAD(P)-dependent oxidoreductase n=1 Tax=Micromonospora sp. TSRI0369 TaxID=1703936 RepID=UPI00093F981D|nr:SDR family oxidoreductase [Micromonospora sp. TSRI0369]OKJ43407.1 hypothetical protein AMK25_20560 [Micromonospora sp. TSRI0369]
MVAVVTGAAGAMGGAIAAELGARGHAVVLADISGRRLAEAADRLTADGRVAHPYRCDVTDRAEAEALAASALAAFGRVDVLVNVVGGYRGRMYEHVLDIPLDRFDEAVRLNLRGTFNLTQLFGRHMRERGAGRIVNISSVAKDGASGQADYAAAKAGVVAFTRSCALELGPAVTVNAVAPGVIRTSVMERIPADVQARYRERIPLGDFGDPVDVARAVAFLAGDDGRYVTGEVIHVSGGFFGCL